MTIISREPVGGPLPSGPVGVNPYERVITSLLQTAIDPPSVPSGVQSNRMPDVIGRSAFAIEPLEAYIRSMKTADLDRQYPFVTMLADAYVNSNRADAELKRQTPLVQARQLSQKELAIWVSVASKMPKERAAELAAIAEQGGVAEVATTAVAQLALARLYVQAGLPEKALPAYVSVVNRIVAGTNNTLQADTLTQTDPYGRDNGLYQFTAITLFDEVRNKLGADALGTFVTEMLAAARPAASPSIQVSYTKFVNILFVRSARLGVRIPALDREAASLPTLAMMTRPEMLQSAYVRARVGKVDEALAIIKSIIQRDFEARTIITALQSNSLYASRQYQIALGLIGDASMMGPFGMTGAGIEEMKPLFPATAAEWPDGIAWVKRVATEIPAWLGQGDINRDAAMQVMTLLALRLQQLGDLDGAKALAGHLSTALARGPVSLKATALAMMAGDRVGAPLQLSVLQDQVRANRLPIRLVVGVLTRTAEAEGAAAALKLGEAAATFTSNDELIRQLVTIAKTSGDQSAIDKWNQRQQDANAARQALVKKGS